MKPKDLLVIGGGPGGLTAALRAAQKGLDVALAEKGQLGGACLNRGCIPSKSLLNVANTAYYAQNSQNIGIKADVNIDYKKAVEWSSKNAHKLVSNTKRILKRSGVEIIKGEASFISSEKAKIGDENLDFDKAIIATGSKPIEIPSIPIDHKRTIDSKDFFELTALPEELIVVGGGYIGMEIGTICRKLGSKVTIIEMLDQLLPNFDKRLVLPITKKAKKLGIEIHLESKITDVDTSEKLKLIAEEKNSNEITFSGDKCLVSIGRAPHTDGLKLEQTSIQMDENGFIETDIYLRTEEENIYAIGDVVGGKMLAHKAYNDAVVAVDNILGEDTKRSIVPEVVFTDPQLAKVGEFKDEYNIGRASFKAIGAAYTKNKTEGTIQIAIDDSGIVKGGQIVGPESSEIVHEIGLAVQSELPVKNLIETIHAHPTLSEGIVKAAEDAGDFSTSSI